jgi:hypothetical protein
MRATSNMTQIELSELTLTPNSKHARLPSLIRARQPGVPTMDFRDTHDLYHTLIGRLDLYCTAPGRCTDELTPSK